MRTPIVLCLVLCALGACNDEWQSTNDPRDLAPPRTTDQRDVEGLQPPQFGEYESSRSAARTSGADSGGDGAPAAPVPEPGTLFLVGSGLAGLALMRRRAAARESQ